MSSSTVANGLPPNFILTPQQQSLLFRALTSNQPSGTSPSANALSVLPTLVESPHQGDSSASNSKPVQESPFLDYDYDFSPDNTFDFDFNNENTGVMVGDLPGSTEENSKDSSNSSSPENDNGDKRSHPEDDDEEREEGGGKRRESDGKVAKKPGRKPLTNEPSSKRKAQNRAAQRAFRERKEQHLKELETKVEELEKASKAANSENSQLRSKVEKMTIELNEYKKKLSLANPTRSITNSRGVWGDGLVRNLNEVNFQFEFPKFGVLPGPQTASNNANVDNGITRSPSFPSPASSFSSHRPSTSSEKSKDQVTPGSSKSPQLSEANSRDALSKFSSIIAASPYDTSSYDALLANASRTSLDSANFSLGGGTNSYSPSASSNSNGGPSSSCGTSPEPFTQSPMGFKPVDTLTTIGEEQTSVTADNRKQPNFGNFDINNFDWLAQQNGGQFDPQLFGDYREPQDNILASATFDDTFFNEAFDADFVTPFNIAPSPKPAKKDICAELDARKENEDTITTTINGKLLTCNNIWERLQTCPKVQSGDIDLDGLCSDLQKKAKCGGSGAVVDERDFKAVMHKHLGPGTCPDSN